LDYLVAGDNMGPSKREKAEKLGVKIISEEDFENLLNGKTP
jgi:DNA ligase (NAD+)